MTASAVRNSLILCSEKIVFCFPAVNVYMLCCCQHYINSQLFFGTLGVFSLSFYTLTEKIYFLTPPTPRETPQKMLFYSAAIQHSFNGGSLVCCCFAFIFFHPVISSHLQFCARTKRETTNTSSELAWKFFENVFFFAEKIVYDTHSTSTFCMGWMLKEKYKISP